MSMPTTWLSRCRMSRDGNPDREKSGHLQLELNLLEISVGKNILPAYRISHRDLTHLLVLPCHYRTLDHGGDNEMVYFRTTIAQ